MDLITSCKDKLAYFRIKELKYVLTQLGLPKQGKKQELVDKILLLLSDEQHSNSNGVAKKLSIEKTRVARAIDDTYRKMQTPRTTEVTSRSQTSSDANHVKSREDTNDSHLLASKGTGVKVRCPCGSSLRTNSMIQCEDPRCQVWQHIECVIIPEKPMEGVFPNLPQEFYCEICRFNRADPFWLTVMHPLLPAILVSANFNPNVSNTKQSVEKTYTLSRADKELLQRTDYDLQDSLDVLHIQPASFGEVWCILLNDKVPFRMQWPQHPDLQVNGIPVRTTNRPGAQLLGINGRDDGPLITTCSREGINKLYLSHCDSRTFCVGIRIAKRRTIQQVLSMIPNEEDGERYEEALARVCRCVGGGNVTDNADSDSDIEVVADSIPVNLRCPISGSRIRIAGRFKPCIHMGCFDLETLVELNQRSRKWQCPICLKNYSLEKIIIDSYFNRITSMMKNCGEDVNEIDVKPDGSWRVKNGSENKDLSRWHLPDGSLSATIEVKVKQGVNDLKLIKQEDTSGFNRGLKLGMRKNQNGVWEVCKPECTSPINQIKQIFDNQFQYSMPACSSDDQSVNQDGSIKIDYPPSNTNNIHVHGTLNFNPTYEVEDRILSEVPTTDANVIVLSDSDDEDTMTMAPPSNPSDISYPSYGYNNSNENGDYVLPQWQMPTYPQAGLQLFGTYANESNALVDASPFNDDYDFSLNGGIGETSGAQNLAAFPNSEGNKNLAGNPSVYGNADPPLQTLFPSHSSENPQSELNDRGVGFHNWISLNLGGGGKADNDSSNGTNSNQQFSAQENDTGL